MNSKRSVRSKPTASSLAVGASPAPIFKLSEALSVRLRAWDKSSVGRVPDFKAADSITGIGQHERNEQGQPDRRRPTRNGLRFNREQCEYTFTGHTDRHEMTKVGGHAEFLQEGRQDWIDCFPTKEEHCRRRWIAKHHAQEQKDRAITQAAEYGDEGVGAQLTYTRA